MERFRKICLWMLLLANGGWMVYILAEVVTANSMDLGNTVFALLLVTMLLNVGLAVLLKRRLGFYYLLAFPLLMLLSLGTNYMVVLPAFYSSVGWGCIASFFLLFAGGIWLCAAQLRARDEKPLKKPKVFCAAQAGAAALAAVVLLAFAVVAYDVLFNFGYSMFELYIGGLLFFLALLAVGFIALALRYLIFAGEKGRRLSFPRVLCVLLCLIAGGFACYGFTAPIAHVPQDVKQAQKDYTAAFGKLKTDALQNQFAASRRQTPFRLSDFFFGIQTKGYDSERNVCYYESKEGVDQGTRLFYDVYYPTEQSEKPYPVLIRMHGSGGDIGNGNYSMPNKYFASRGYVVYEIQYGDWNEKQDTPVKRNPAWGIEKMQAYIREFIRYAKAHNTHNADWGSVFVSGNSFGGMMGDALALSFGNDPAYDALGITVKGLVPFYPAGDLTSKNPKENPVMLVNKNSPPCLMYMGTHDGYVNRGLAYELQDAYKQAGNQQFMVYAPKYAGHGSDGYFSGYYMQVHLYFMERFMLQYQ